MADLVMSPVTVSYPDTVPLAAEQLRHAVLDTTTHGSVDSVEILTQPANGHAYVKKDGTSIALDMNDSSYTGSDSFTFRVTAGGTKDVTCNVTSTAVWQPLTWGNGNAAHARFDSNDNVIATPSASHLEVWVTKHPTNGWDKARIAAAESISESAVTGAWLTTTGYSLGYGASTGVPLMAGQDEAANRFVSVQKSKGMIINYERGYDYDTTVGPGPWVNDFWGVDPLRPTIARAWGTGAKPLVRLGDTGNQTADKTGFVVLENLTIKRRPGASSNASNINNNLWFLFNKCTINCAITFNTPFRYTLRMCKMLDVYQDESDNALWSTDTHGDRIFSIWFIDGQDIRITKSLFDAGGYNLAYTYAGTPGGTGDDGQVDGQPPSEHNHNGYFSGSNNFTYMNNWSSRASSIGASNGAGGYITDNVFVKNSIMGNCRASGKGSGNADNSGNQQIMVGNVQTVGEDKIALSGAQKWGFGYSSRYSSYYQNLALHSEITMANDPLGKAWDSNNVYLPPRHDNITYDWPLGDNAGYEEGTSGLTTSALDAVTIGDFTDTLLSTTGSDAVDLIDHMRGIDDHYSVIRDFRAYMMQGAETAGKTGWAVPVRTVPETLHLDAQGYTDSRRLDMPANLEGYKEVINGDSINSYGAKAIWAGDSVEVDDYAMAAGGSLTLYSHMKMTGTLTTGAGCSLNLESGGDLEIAGWSGANALAINMTAGRLENTGAMSNVDLTIGSEFTGAYYVPGIFILDEGSSLTPNNLTLTGNAVVAFDGSAGGTATLTLAGTTTFAYEAMTGKRYPLEQASAEGSTGGDGPQSGKILKMQAGIHGAQAPNVIANVVLGGDLAVDVTGLASGIYDLIDVDSVTGSFESTTITGGSGTINVTTTKVQLTI